MKKAFRAAADAIQSAQKIVLASHLNPDGDTLGSSLALTLALTWLGKTAVPLSHDGVPEILRWMPGQERIQKTTPDRDFDLAIVCDTRVMERIGAARDAVLSAPLRIVLDHHIAGEPGFDIEIVNTKASATGELAFDLLRELFVPFDADIADCLMCALITDTGSFRFPNVTPTTFRIASKLLSSGAQPARIYELVFEDRSFASIKLLGRALDALQRSDDGLVSWTHVRAQDFTELGATDEETEGIVNHVRAVRGAQVGILFREVPGGTKIRISLRAREGYDVNRVAQAFGGGGHHLAAGCSLSLPLPEAEKAVLEEVRRWL